MTSRPVTVKLTPGELLGVQVLIDSKACDSVSDALVQGLYLLLHADPDTRAMVKDIKEDRKWHFRRRRSKRIPGIAT